MYWFNSSFIKWPINYLPLWQFYLLHFYLLFKKGYITDFSFVKCYIIINLSWLWCSLSWSNFGFFINYYLFMNLYVVYSGLLRVGVGKNITIDLLKFTLIRSKFVFLLYEINVFNCYNQIFETQEKVDKRGKKYCLIGIKISSLRNS